MVHPTFKFEWYDLEKVFKAFGYDDFDAGIMADYFDECVSWEVDFTAYIWNVAPYRVACIEGGKDEAIQYIKAELGDDYDMDDCTIYVCERLGGVYIEWC